MDQLPTPSPDNGGWYLAAALAVAGVLKAIVERFQKRDLLDSRRGADAQEHRQGLELKALAAEESATAQLVTDLRGRVDTLERLVNDLQSWKIGRLESEAARERQIARLEADLDRIRKQRDRAIRTSARAVELAQRAPKAAAVEAGRLAAEMAELAAEVSAADEASSGAQRAAP